MRRGSSNIRYPQQAMAANGTQGTSGVRKGRGRSGSRRRRTMTPAATSAKAKSVPMLVSSTSSLMLAMEEQTATKTPVRMVVTCGVRKRGCTLAAHAGSRPSRPIEKKMRGWPAW